MNEHPIDPDVIALLHELGPAGASAAHSSAHDLRRGVRDAFAVFTRGAERITLHRVSDTTVGDRLPVRLYGPEAPTAVMIYLHGGAWITGDLDTHDLTARRLSRDTGALVVAVDYRLLPENAFPAPIDDAYDAAVWASSLHPALPFVVAGDSAGATLAACVALRARDDNGPRIDLQVLVYPAIDDDLGAPSVLAFGDGPLVTADDLRFYLHGYASTAAALGSPYALPGRAVSLTGLPPAVIAIAGHDMLRSAEEDYVERLRDAGVPVTVQLDLELVHGWIDFAPRVASADRALRRLTDTLGGLIHRVGADQHLRGR